MKTTLTNKIRRQKSGLHILMRSVHPIPKQDKDRLTKEFGEYLTQAFSQRLVKHMHRAKKAALLKAQD